MGHLPDITVVSFGKPKAMWRPILDTYEKRLAKATRFSHLILRERGSGADDVKDQATKALAPHLDAGTFVIVFDERGVAMSSTRLAELLAEVRPKPVSAVIGTSYGLADEVLARADTVLNLGAMTLPHEIARATVLEQLYRADTILSGHPYHHG